MRQQVRGKSTLRRSSSWLVLLLRPDTTSCRRSLMAASPCHMVTPSMSTWLPHDALHWNVPTYCRRFQAKHSTLIRDAHDNGKCVVHMPSKRQKGMYRTAHQYTPDYNLTMGRAVSSTCLSVAFHVEAGAVHDDNLIWMMCHKWPGATKHLTFAITGSRVNPAP